MNSRVREAAALRAWAVQVIPLAGSRATTETLASAAKVSMDRMRHALRTLVADGRIAARLQDASDANGSRRSVVYAVVSE